MNSNRIVLASLFTGLAGLLLVCGPCGRAKREPAKFADVKKADEKANETKPVDPKVNESRKKMDEADALWNRGDKAAAVQLYKAFYTSTAFPVSKVEKEMVLPRVVSYELTAGNTGEAKKWVNRCLDDKLQVWYTDTPSKDLEGVVKKEREQRAAAEAEEKRKKAEADAALAEEARKKREAEAALAEADRNKRAEEMRLRLAELRKKRESEPPPPPRPAPKDDLPAGVYKEFTRGCVIGNRNSKVYHLPGTQYYEKVKTSKYAVFFKTEEDAKRAKYHKAGGGK